MLLRLDRPIDPNLVITVNGKPLKRVRDWRGRATSILPPAQSGSDLSAQASASGSLYTRQLKSDRSLLESDQFDPNSWFPVSSQDLLLNISKDVASDYEFPAIRLTDAGGTVVIPYDLRQNVTELTINGFHMKPRTDREITFETIRNLRSGDSVPPYIPLVGQSKVLSYGPYPYSTFLPLFSMEPVSKRLYAYIGETGDDLMIGFLSGSAGRAGRSAADDESKYLSLLETHTQVILEDRNLDFAWSLSCLVQGSQLACELPRKAIGQAYEAARDACVTSPPDADPFNPKECPGFPQSTEDSFTKGLQVWVEQFDPEGKDAFYSPEPVSLGLFYWDDAFYVNHDYRPWHFLSATAGNYQVEACSYFVDSQNHLLEDPSGKNVEVLSAPDVPILETSIQRNAGLPDRCGYFSVSTPYLQAPQLAFRLDGIDATVTVPTERLRPEFKRPQVTHSVSGATEAWLVDFAVRRTVCSDIDSVQTQLAGTPITARWWDGLSPVGACPADAAWSKDDSNSQIHLKLSVPRSALASLPENLHLIRSSANGAVDVASLPSLRRLLLPSKLKVTALSDSQFELSGDHAGVIDSVVVSNGTRSETFKASSTGDFALVTALVPNPSYKPPAKPAPQPKPQGAQKPAQPQGQQQGQQPQQGQQQQQAPQQPPKADQPKKPGQSAKNSIGIRQQSEFQLLAASYRLPSNSRQGTAPPANQTPPQPSTPAPGSALGAPRGGAAAGGKAGNGAAGAAGGKGGAAAGAGGKAGGGNAGGAGANNANNQSQDAQSRVPQFISLDPGSYTIVPMIDVNTDPKAKPHLIPLTVTDPQGKPLIFTVPKPASDTTTANKNSGTPQTCAVPCVLAPCAATCPPAPAKPAATTP